MSANSLTLTWTASSDPTVAGRATSGVAGYRAYLNGVQQVPGPVGLVTSYQFTNLAPTTTYTLGIEAVDAAGNVSVRATIQGTTQAAVTGWPLMTPAYTSIVPNVAGFGCDTVAGYGGTTGVRGNALTVYRVTNLNDTGAGSFRTGIAGVAGRVVVFDIGGIIQCNSLINAGSTNRITIAGASAPGKGVLVRRGHVRVRGSHWYISHMHFRPGDDAGGEAIGSGTRDGLELIGNAGHISGLVIDHCTTGWSIDSCLDVTNDLSDCTLVSCLMAEGLDGAFEHALGSIIGAYNTTQTTRISLLRNVWMSNIQRHPRVGALGVYLANNVIYNWRDIATDFEATGADTLSSVVNNVYIRGPLNSAAQQIRWRGTDSPSGGNTAGSRLYLSGNYAGNTAASVAPVANQWSLVDLGSGKTQANSESLSPLSMPPGVVLADGSAVLALVLATVGAFPNNRDAADLRLMGEIPANTGGIKTTVASAGGWPAYTTTGGPGFWDGGADPIPDGVGGRPAPNQLEANGLPRIENWVRRRNAEREVL